jgi:hypothetical protein
MHDRSNHRFSEQPPRRAGRAVRIRLGLLASLVAFVTIWFVGLVTVAQWIVERW